ncbi:MAG: hypothetical protein ABSF54_17190 [Bryobacteraceae bacterium]|jgi:hypothetical protein
MNGHARIILKASNAELAKRGHDRLLENGGGFWRPYSAIFASLLYARIAAF